MVSERIARCADRGHDRFACIHRLRTIKAYEYRDAATLLADFWTTVDAVLRERGVIR